jgi:hypothetical protein
VSLSLTNRKSSVHLHTLYSPRRDQLVICGQYLYWRGVDCVKGRKRIHFLEHVLLESDYMTVNKAQKPRKTYYTVVTILFNQHYSVDINQMIQFVFAIKNSRSIKEGVLHGWHYTGSNCKGHILHTVPPCSSTCSACSEIDALSIVKRSVRSCVRTNSPNLVDKI